MLSFKDLLCVIFCFEAVFCQSEFITNQEPCDIKEGGVGRCVSIKFCMPYLTLIQKEPLSPNVISLLTAAHCGFYKNNPMVCCPESNGRSLSSSPTEVSFPSSSETDRTTSQRSDLYSTFLMPPVCDVSNGSSGRVVGGVDSKIEFIINQEPCDIKEGGVGRCVSIKSCMPYLTLLQREPLSPNVISLLTAAHCGFDKNNPMVCCPESNGRSLSSSPTEVSFPSSSETDYTTSQRSDLNSTFLMPPVCGVSNGSSGRVVGGVDAKLGDLPWMALLGYKDREGPRSWRCGGSLISSRHVLTAAHCIHHYEEELYVVRLGELNLDQVDESVPIDVLIKHAIKHEEYDLNSYTNDIGLLILDRNVEFTNFIRPICLPTRPDLLSNSFVDYNPLVAGWGRTLFKGPTASHLQVAQVPVMGNSNCVKSFTDYPAVIDERTLCAGWAAGGRDACEGDSGGPLTQPDYDPEKKTSYFYQIGIISYGRGCAQAGFPAVYMRVTHYLPWIQTYMFKNID